MLTPAVALAPGRRWSRRAGTRAARVQTGDPRGDRATSSRPSGWRPWRRLTNADVRHLRSVAALLITVDFPGEQACARQSPDCGLGSNGAVLITLVRQSRQSPSRPVTTMFCSARGDVLGVLAKPWRPDTLDAADVVLPACTPPWSDPDPLARLGDAPRRTRGDVLPPTATAVRRTAPGTRTGAPNPGRPTGQRQGVRRGRSSTAMGELRANLLVPTTDRRADRGSRALVRVVDDLR